MGFKFKACIFAVGVMTGIYYYLKRRNPTITIKHYPHPFIGPYYDVDIGLDYDEYTDDEYTDDDFEYDLAIASESEYFGNMYGVEDVPDNLDSETSEFYPYDYVIDYMLDDENRLTQVYNNYLKRGGPYNTVPRRKVHYKTAKNKKVPKTFKIHETKKRPKTFNKECPICTDTFKSNKYVTLACSHRLHNSCAFLMARSVQNLSCPLCRQRVELTE